MEDAETKDRSSDDQGFFIKEHTGEHYRHLLRRLHRDLKPKNYFEIGIRKGASLTFARVSAIGVDPRFSLADDFLEKRPNIKVFPCTSDDYFKDYDPKGDLGAPIDFAFLDGLHHCDALLKDFLNTEKLSAKDSVIVLHDCIPTDLGMTRREQRSDAEHYRRANHWAGDVWKIIPILKRYRPDLRMAFLDAPPTGLVLITDLNPDDMALSENYDAIVGEMEDMDLIKIGLSTHYSNLNVRPTSSINSRSDI